MARWFKFQRHLSLSPHALCGFFQRCSGWAATTSYGLGGSDQQFRLQRGSGYDYPHSDRPGRPPAWLPKCSTRPQPQPQAPAAPPSATTTADQYRTCPRMPISPKAAARERHFNGPYGNTNFAHEGMGGNDDHSPTGNGHTWAQYSNARSRTAVTVESSDRHRTVIYRRRRGQRRRRHLRQRGERYPRPALR